MSPGSPSVSPAFGFFTARGFGALVNRAGQGFSISLPHNGGFTDRLFWNIGQPDQSPPCHHIHRDDTRYRSDIIIEKARLKPFAAVYTIGRNRFSFVECDDRVHFRFDLKEEAVFDLIHTQSSRSGQHLLEVSGITLGRPVTGHFTGVLGTDLKTADTDFFPEHLLPGEQADPSLCALLFNLSMSPQSGGKFYVPVNKAWEPMIAGIYGIEEESARPMVFAWDSAFAVIIAAHYDTALARGLFDTLLSCQQKDGRIPQLTAGGLPSDRSGPPVWFLAAETISHSNEGLDFIKDVYGALERNYHWYLRNRRNGDSTFAWGADDACDAFYRIPGHAGAQYESGMDDSPLYAGIPFEGNRLAAACVDLTSLLAAAASVMRGFALRQGLDASFWDLECRAFDRILPLFFDYGSGLCNSFSYGPAGPVYCRELTPVSFYPLLYPGLGSREALLLTRLYRSGHFRKDGHAGLPSLSYQSAFFTAGGDYWRGRVWPPHVYLAARGFENHDPRTAGEIRDEGRELLCGEWEQFGHIHENYSPAGGRGEPPEGVYARSCSFYIWGGLLGLCPPDKN